jgi:site-specific recombinase XerD
MRRDFAQAMKGGVIAERAVRVRHYAEKATADNTQRAMKSQWNKFAAWCVQERCDRFPAEAQMVCDYITYLADTGSSASTIDSALWAISKMHEMRKAPNPRKTSEVQLVRKGIRNEIGTRPDGCLPLMIEQIRRIVEPLGSTSRDLRDRALVLIGFAGAFRRSELEAMNMEDVRPTEKGLEITIPFSKGDQQGEGDIVGIPLGKIPETCPVLAFSRWLRILEVTHKERGSTCPALFRSIGQDRWPSGRLPAADVGRILKGHLERIGVDATDYGAHSLRVGFATVAYLAGKSRAAIQKHLRQKTTTMTDRYIKPLDVFNLNPADGIGL